VPQAKATKKPKIAPKGAEKSQHQEIALEKLEQLMRYIPAIMPTQDTAEKICHYS